MIEKFHRNYPSKSLLITKLREPHCDSPIQRKRKISSEMTSEYPVVSAGVQAGNVLKKFVIDNYHLKWGKTLLRGKWTLSRFLDDACLYDIQQVQDSLRMFGLLPRTLTSDLAGLMNNAFRNSTTAVFAEVLYHLIGTKDDQQGRIEVERVTDTESEWYIFNEEFHRWVQLEKRQSGCLLAVLRGLFAAYRQYLIRYAYVVDATSSTFEVDKPNAMEWFESTNNAQYHPIRSCYQKIVTVLTTPNRLFLQDLQGSLKRLLQASSTSQCGSLRHRFNKNKPFIAFKNGIYDLKNHTLRPGIPEDFVLHHVGYEYVDWNNDALTHSFDFRNQSLVWRGFFAEIFPDKETTTWVQRTSFLDRWEGTRFSIFTHWTKHRNEKYLSSITTVSS